jgi:hypothetical protein
MTPDGKIHRKSGPLMPKASTELLLQQLGEQRRTVDFDTYDMQVQELLRQLGEGQISVAPAYQRQFRWDDKRCSELIESLLLGIPIPNIFMATNETERTWEVVDGVQRLSSMVKFAGDDGLRQKLALGDPLRLDRLQKLTAFDGMAFSELPPAVQQHFNTRPLKVVTLNDKSDKILRIDLFERLNTGGVELTDQEIRDCVFYGQFSDTLDKLAGSQDLHKILNLTSRQEKDGTRKECVLRFFAYLDRYKRFVHSVKDFLDDYMRDATESFSYSIRIREFDDVMAQLAAAFPNGIMRPNRKGRTSLVLFEGVAVGAALAIRNHGGLETQGLTEWMASDELRDYTTGATNDKSAVRNRIEFCRDRFMGEPYVPRTQD